MDRQKIEELKTMLEAATSTVFFGGAGVSTESGVPDFRSATGIYAQHLGAERILTPGFMLQETEEFFRFNRKFFQLEGIKPNACHRVLAALEKQGLLDVVITQNIDGLHQEAGSGKVIELHGSTKKHYCISCGKIYTADEVAAMDLVPRCTKCQALVRPDIVLYEESLKRQDLIAAVQAIEQADLLIIGGTSLTVYPAAGLIDYQKPSGKKVLINKSPSYKDKQVDLVIHEAIGEVFAALANLMELAY